MPAIPMPTDVPAYQRLAAYEQSKDWMDENLPGGPLGAPIKLYASAAATLKTGVVRGDPATGAERITALGILALPVVAGYVAHRRSHGDLRWTIGAGVGIIPALTLVGAALVYGSIAGSYGLPGFASAMQPLAQVLSPVLQPFIRISSY